jgi:hypothetical protein
MPSSAEVGTTNGIAAGLLGQSSSSSAAEANIVQPHPAAADDGEGEAGKKRHKNRKNKKKNSKRARKLLPLEEPVSNRIVRMPRRRRLPLCDDILIDVFRFLLIDHLFRLNWHSRRLFHLAGKHHGVAEVCFLVYLLLFY